MRREKGMGCVSQRKDGTWTGRIDLGYQPNGKKKIKAVYGKTEAEVKRKLKDLRNEIAKGEFKQDIKAITVKTYMNNWLVNYKKNEVKPSTYDLIESTCNNLIFPRIGNYQLAAVKPSDIQNMINDLTEKGYSYSTIRKAYNYTKSAYTFALERKEVTEIPFAKIILPKSVKKDMSEIVFYNEDEIKLIKENALTKFPHSDAYIFRYGYAIILLLYTGLRCGELLGLKWEDVDYENNSIKVRRNLKQVVNRDEDVDQKYVVIEQSTKTKSGIRSVPLSNMAKEALAYYEKIRTDSPYVLSSKKSKPVSARNLDRAFRNILTRAGITKQYGVHSLRHTFASMLFKKGVDVKTVSEILGHSDVSVTYNIYIHIINEQKVRAIEQLNDF